DADGKLLRKHGADFDRLKVALSTATLGAGKPVPARIDFSCGLQEGLLNGELKKTAEARGSTVSAHLRPKSGGAWQKLAGLVVPADLQGPCTLRFTTAAGAEGAGATVDFDVVVGR